MLPEHTPSSVDYTTSVKGLLGWADRSRSIQMHANADSGEDVRTAKELGASGIGLCRLEHVLAAGGGTAQLREAVAQQDPAARARAVVDVTQLLTALLTDILLAADGLPVTIRLLDVARHELVDGPVDEVNPMMGARGVRNFLLNPELGVAQVAAIARSCRAVAELGLRTDVRILVPMVGLCGEHADDPTSVEYLVSLGVDYLSCSPRRVPLARFSAGRSELTRSTALPS